MVSKGILTGGAFALIVIFVFINAGIGNAYYLNKAHPTCYDGIDNDNYDPLDLRADFNDLDCLYMPYDFGFGESANPDSMFGTSAFFHPDPEFQLYAQQWNESGSNYPTLYDFLVVHYYDGTPCETSSTNPTKNSPEFLLSFWKNQYDISDSLTGYDDWLDKCN